MIGGHRETLSAGRGCENQALIQQTSIWTENACMVGYENRTIIDLKTENKYKTQQAVLQAYSKPLWILHHIVYTT